MNRYIYFIAIVMFAFLLGGCEKDIKTHVFPPADVDFNYTINSGDYRLAYIIGSEIDFENLSVLTGTPTWDFGDGKTSIEPNPVHVYNKPGIYDIKLTVDNQTATKKILVNDMKVLVSYTSTGGNESIINSSVISLDVELPNPGNYPATYKWILPEGTMDENGNIVTESDLQNPGKLTFKNVGSQQLRLETIIDTEDGKRKLDTERVNVQIGYSTPVKTIYLGCKDGVLRAFKLIPNLPSGVKNTQFNLPASSGSHPFNLLFNKADTTLYVLDAGAQFYFVEDKANNLGDGRITAITKDGSSTQVVVSNVGGTAFNDPFYGYFDANSKTIYFSDRNTGIRTISGEARNASVITQPYFVENGQLGYYDAKMMAYGAGNGNFTKVGDVWWWSKYFLSQGIYRFTAADIGQVSKIPAAGIAASAVGAIKSFAVNMSVPVIGGSEVYFAITSGTHNGFYAMSLANFNLLTSSNASSLLPPARVAVLPSDTEGTESERVYITQMVIDDADGCVYFGYRAPAGVSATTGLKRYNPVTKLLETYLEGLEIYGVAINDNKSKLF